MSHKLVNYIITAAGCVSAGPSDAISIPVSIDRGQMTLGDSIGTVLVASDGAATRVVEVYAQALLVADFSADNQVPEPGRAVSFMDQSQTALPGEPIIQRVWDFGDGTKITEGNLLNPNHVYAEEGSYTVTLTVSTASRSQQVAKKDFIVVSGRIPAADFAMSSTDVFTGEILFFTDRSTSGVEPITNWLWQFGDGSTSTERNPQHAYTASGDYAVTLAVSNRFGSSAKTAPILVRAIVLPKAGFEVGEAVVNATTQFTDTSVAGTRPIKAWLWKFGDGKLSNDPISPEQPGCVPPVPKSIGMNSASSAAPRPHGPREPLARDPLNLRPRQ